MANRRFSKRRVLPENTRKAQKSRILTRFLGRYIQKSRTFLCGMPAPQVGLEPTTLRLTAECSAIELLRHVVNQRLILYQIVHVMSRLFFHVPRFNPIEPDGIARLLMTMSAVLCQGLPPSSVTPGSAGRALISKTHMNTGNAVPPFLSRAVPATAGGRAIPSALRPPAALGKARLRCNPASPPRARRCAAGRRP